MLDFLQRTGEDSTRTVVISLQEGSTHLPPPSASRSEGAKPPDSSPDPRLRSLNEALSLHGYPPLPHLPRFLKESVPQETSPEQKALSSSRTAAAEELKIQTIEQLIEWINSGKGLPSHVLTEFSGDKYASFYQSWLLPPTRMPSVNPGLAKSPWPTPHRTGFSQARNFPACDASLVEQNRD